MFSTPLICSSIGATTVEATTSALAPGYWPVTLMIGGAISGYCAIGSRTNATAPRMTNTIETTEAKIGRSMKKCEMRIARLPRCRPYWVVACDAVAGGGASVLRRHLAARPRAHQAVDDDAIVGREPFLDHAQAVDQLAERHVVLPRDVVGVDDQHEFARLLGADRRIRHQQRRIGGEPGTRTRANMPGVNRPSRIGEHRAAADRAGARDRSRCRRNPCGRGGRNPSRR